jgi:hypothetical protein
MPCGANRRIAGGVRHRTYKCSDDARAVKVESCPRDEEGHSGSAGQECNDHSAAYKTTYEESEADQTLMSTSDTTSSQEREAFGETSRHSNIAPASRVSANGCTCTRVRKLRLCPWAQTRPGLLGMLRHRPGVDPRSGRLAYGAHPTADRLTDPPHYESGQRSVNGVNGPTRRRTARPPAETAILAVTTLPRVCA